MPGWASLSGGEGNIKGAEVVSSDGAWQCERLAGEGERGVYGEADRKGCG